MRTYIQINPADNVVVAVKNLQTGVSLDINGRTIVVLQDIPAGHKVALQDFKEGDHVIKYGAPIGHAREVMSHLLQMRGLKPLFKGAFERVFNVASFTGTTIYNIFCKKITGLKYLFVRK